MLSHRLRDVLRHGGSLCRAATRPAPFSSSTPYATTVLAVRKDNQVVIVADGQCTAGSRVLKPNVKKLRRLGEDGVVIVGFAGAVADAFTLFSMLESKLEEYPGQLTRAAVEVAKVWRKDKHLRLDAEMVVADAETTLTITGQGEVVEPHDGIISIGSGSPYALAAARALIDIPGMTAMQIAEKSMNIAADTCIYTNHNFTVETIPAALKEEWGALKKA